MPLIPATRSIPAPLIRDAFDEFSPIIDAISDRFPIPGHPLAEPLLRLLNWTGRTQMALKPWLKMSSGPRRQRVK